MHFRSAAAVAASNLKHFQMHTATQLPVLVSQQKVLDSSDSHSGKAATTATRDLVLTS